MSPDHNIDRIWHRICRCEINNRSCYAHPTHAPINFQCYVRGKAGAWLYGLCVGCFFRRPRTLEICIFWNAKRQLWNRAVGLQLRQSVGRLVGRPVGWHVGRHSRSIGPHVGRSACRRVGWYVGRSAGRSACRPVVRRLVGGRVTRPVG